MPLSFVLIDRSAVAPRRRSLFRRGPWAQAHGYHRCLAPRDPEKTSKLQECREDWLPHTLRAYDSELCDRDDRAPGNRSKTKRNPSELDRDGEKRFAESTAAHESR